MITRLQIPAAAFAEQNNALQAIAERGRLGIPLTISTDPRSHFQVVVGASGAGSGFSQWPETLGLGALNEPTLTKQFADIVRAEYLVDAVGFNRVRGLPLASEEISEAINQLLGST